MPELPEVEAERRSLKPTIVGKTIARVEVRRPGAVRRPAVRQFIRALAGRKILGVRRLGKALLLDLSGGWVLVFRFMLWGILRFARTTPGRDSRTAVAIHFRDGSSLEFRDLQLSTFELWRGSKLRRHEFFSRLGIDPLSPELTGDQFHALLQVRGTVRAVLCDQERFAGIGNLWAHEILHAARIRPGRRAKALSAAEVSHLFQAVRRILPQAIRRGGEPDFVDARGRSGRYRLAVYGRGGQRCPRGDGLVRASRLGGRPSFFCPSCQR